MSLYVELFLPLIISNIAHMFVVKRDHFSALNRPISSKLFGQNKTVRGFVFVGLTTALLQLFTNRALYGGFSLDALVLGLSLGVMYMLSELPNSFMKRRLGIKSGEKPERGAWLFTILDKSDSTLGVCATFTVYKGLPVLMFLKLFISAFCIHLVLSHILHLLRIKSSL